MSSSVGKRLAEARKARGLSLDDVTRSTKMRPAIIDALEAENFARFPSITHARSFLSLYGKFLKIDVQDGLAGLTTPAKIGVENYQYLNVERDAEQSFRTHPTSRRIRSLPALRGDQLPKSLGILALVIAVLFFVGYLAINLKRLNLSNKSPSADAASSSAPPPSATPPLSPGAIKNPDASPDRSPFYAPISEDHRLIPKTRRPPAP